MAISCSVSITTTYKRLKVVFVSCLNPDAEVVGQHVHEAKARNKLSLVDVHLLVKKNKVPGIKQYTILIFYWIKKTTFVRKWKGAEEPARLDWVRCGSCGNPLPWTACHFYNVQRLTGLRSPTYRPTLGRSGSSFQYQRLQKYYGGGFALRIVPSRR